MDYKTLCVFVSLFLFGTLEIFFPFFADKNNIFQKFSVNFSLGIINILATSLTTTLLLKWIWQPNHQLGILQLIQLPWFATISSFLLLDLYMYCWHRLMHTSSLGWRFHQVHHTERRMNISTTYRFHTLEVITSNLPKIFLVWLLGIQPIPYLIYEIAFTIELVFHHSNWALPSKLDQALSHLIVTPNYHRLHHSEKLRDTQANYASILTIWDQLLGSFHYPKHPEKIRLGLAGQPPDLRLFNLLTLRF